MLIVEADLQCPLDDVEGFAGAAMHVRCRRLIFRRHDEVQQRVRPAGVFSGGLDRSVGEMELSAIVWNGWCTP